MLEKRANNIAPPNINVTPLIDVLLVLLIIFMVASPLRPHRFETKVPSEPDNQEVAPNINTLVVTVNEDLTLKLNAESDMGTVNDMSKLNEKLIWLFGERTKNRVYRDGMATRSDLPDSERIQRTVFIKAPKRLPYGEVAKVIDGLKGSGAQPIGLQIDALN